MVVVSILIVISFIGLLIFAFLLSLNQTKVQNDFRKFFQDEIHILKAELQGHLQNSSQILQTSHSEVSQRLDNASRVVADVREKLGRLEESSRSIYEVGKDISSLQELLRSPKIRGGLGEFFLGDILSQIMPSKEFYSLQHEFKSKEKVDAVLRVGKRLVPIDAKFPLENFKKFVSAKEEEKKAFRKMFLNDVKNHIKSISEKYILPDEETYDFALMYIPAENVYYETIIKENELELGQTLFNFSLNKKVIPVSPNSLYAYLQVIILGLKGMHVERSAELIINTIYRLRGDIRKFSDDFSKIGKHLKDSKACFDNAEKHFEKINEKLTSIETPQAGPVLEEPSNNSGQISHPSNKEAGSFQSRELKNSSEE